MISNVIITVETNNETGVAFFRIVFFFYPCLLAIIIPPREKLAIASGTTMLVITDRRF